MSNVLLKDVIVTVLSPGTPATPGSPGSPGSPAWDEVVDYDTVAIVGWRDYYVDSSGNVHDLVPPEQPPPGYKQHFDPIYGPVHVHEVIHHPAVPAVPPNPGSPGTPPVLSTNYQLGWNCSADSIDSIIGSGEYKFSVDSNTIGCFTGLSAVAVGEDYKRIQYGLYFTNHNVEVWESGAHVAASSTFVSGDVFTIRRLGPEVAYYQGSTLLYRSLVPSYGTLIAYADMYAGGDQIDNASIGASVDSALSGTTPGILSVSVPQPVFWASEKNGLLNISVPQPRIWASADGSIHATLPTPIVSILGKDFAGGTISLPSPAVNIEADEETPAYGILETDTPYPSMYMSVDAIAGAMNISVPRPKFLAWTGGGILQVSVPQPKFLALGDTQIGIINAFAPMARAIMDGDVLPGYFNLGIHATAPRATAHLYSGAFIKAAAPRATAAIVATTSNHFTITASAPVATAVVTGLAGSDSAIVARAPMPTTRMYAGGRIVATAPKATAALAVRTGTVLAITATAPEAKASVSGFAGHVATVAASAPRATALHGYSFITAYAPMSRALLAANSAAYSITDAYSVTLNNPAKPVTRYTNYPFHNVVRFGNDYLGFGPTGVFKLSGADDAGTPILWRLQFGNTTETPGDEFGQGFRKTNYGAYFDGRFTGTAMLSVSVDDGTVYTYSKLMPNNQRDTLRFVPGKGLRGFSWQFGLSGTGPCDVYRAEFLQRALTRKVKHG